MTEASKQISLLYLTPCSETVEAVMAAFAKDAHVQLVRCESIASALQAAQTPKYVCLVLSGSNDPQFLQMIELLKALAARVQTPNLRTLLVGNTQSVAILSQLSMQGCSDVVREPVQARALQFKVNRHVMALVKLLENEKEVQEVTVLKSETPTIELPMVYRLDPALTLAVDFWFLPKGSPRIRGQEWVIKMRGPSPEQGDWEGAGEGMWAWKAPLAETEGKWTFRGSQKPTYTKGAWRFEGSHLELSYTAAGRVLGRRFHIDQTGTLILLKNSEASKAGLDDILKQAVKYELIEKDRAESAKAEGNSEKDEILNIPAGYVLGPVLDFEEDYWAMKQSRPKWLNSQWQIRWMGPSPEHGRWVDAALTGEAPGQKWKWVFRRVNVGEANKDLGHWEFRGSQPVYEDGDWVFTSKKPEFVFLQSPEGKLGHAVGNTIKMKCLEENLVEVSEDSPHAGERLAKLYGKILQTRIVTPQKAFRLPLKEGISVLNLAGVVADLALRPVAALPQITYEFCKKISSSVTGGVKVEFWALDQGHWTFLNSNDQMLNRNDAILNTLESDLIRTEIGQIFSPILGPLSGPLPPGGDPNKRELIGALVLSGPGAAHLKDEVIYGYSWVARGIALGSRKAEAA